ncbi:type II toxin-antitoxin system PemK/MazF family toxin [Kitasatospora sp. LaBMicrA B282]|uniref:type II toxin-antitoxin system PemK/MazF family toxin n=1 Tax=Kitasatospora sp. LaBMicrA B282 TaxID=3420949 RepID=UPI003D13AC5C
MNVSNGASLMLVVGLLVLAVVAVLVLLGAATRYRPGRRPPGRPAAAPRPTRPDHERNAGGRRPAPREIWWAEVPFEDGPGSKDRPCLVLRVQPRSATVLKITSKHHAELAGLVELAPTVVGDRQGRTSWLETGERREVPLHAFRRRVGPLDQPTWERVQHAVERGGDRHQPR